MHIPPPEGIVARVNNPFKKFWIKGLNGPGINLNNRTLDIPLLDQGGMLQGRYGEILVGAPGELAEGGDAHNSGIGGLGAGAIKGGKLPEKLDHLVLVIDTSNSMTFEHQGISNFNIKLIQEQIKRLGPFIPPGTKVSIVEFNKRAKVTLDAAEIKSERDFEAVVRTLENLKTDGGTNLTEGISVASEQIGKTNSYNHSTPERNLMILITDGSLRISRSPESPISLHKKLYSKVQEVCPLRNAPLIVLGLGAGYSPNVIQTMAAFSQGMWAHIPSNDTSLVDPFGKIIPSQIRQICSNPWSLRLDVSNNAEKVFGVNPCVIEVPFSAQRQDKEDGLGVFEYRPGFEQEPSGVVTFDPKTGDPIYWLSGNNDMRLHYQNPEELILPDDFGVELPIKELDELYPEEKKKAEETLKKWLIAEVFLNRDIQALYALMEVRLISRNEFQNIANAWGYGESGVVDEESCRSAETDRVTRNPETQFNDFNEFQKSGNLFEEMKQSNNSDSESGSLDFERQIRDLDKAFNKVPGEFKSFQGSAPHGNSVSGYSFRRNDGDGSLSLNLDDHSGNLGPLSMEGRTLGNFKGGQANVYNNLVDPKQQHSGGLGPLDEPPNKIIPPFQAAAVEEYDDGKPKSISFKLTKIEPSEGNFEVDSPFGFSLDEGIWTIGRDPKANIVISNNEKVSRIHCEISKEGKKVFITDRRSTNGVFVNDEQINNSRRLQDGDIINIGGFKCRVNITVKDIQEAKPNSIPKSIRLKIDGSRHLVISLKEVESKDFSLTEMLKVGRGKDCQVRISNLAMIHISNSHFEIFKADGKVYVRDLGSRKGTIVNDNKITKATEIKNGDTIQIGGMGALFEFKVEIK